MADLKIHPLDYEAETSMKLLEAIHRGDSKAAVDLIGESTVDVNFIGAVNFRSKKVEVVLREEESDEVRVEYEEFRTDVNALFLASHAGNLALVRKLLSAGADVNQKLFRGYATTAAVRENKGDVLVVLLKAGAAQPACEEALIEACLHGRAKLTELLMGSDLIRPQTAVHALVSAASRGYADVIDTLIKHGVDANATARILLRSIKPSLHINADCTALVAAIVSKQVSVVKQLLLAGVKKDIKVSLGAWSWDTNNGEEFRVGAGLADPYNIAWCAVEYFESTGTILKLVLNHYSSNSLHLTRTLLHHAILCSNARAAHTLLSLGAEFEFPVKTARNRYFRPIHLAARLGQHLILNHLIDKGCEVDSITDAGDTALMLACKFKREDCVCVLVSRGADIGLVNSTNASAEALARKSTWNASFTRAVLDAIRSGANPKSSNHEIFSPILFVASTGEVNALEALLTPKDFDIDEQDSYGFTALMVAAKEGHVDAFRLLVFAGANVKLKNNSGETAIDLSRNSKKSELFEQVMLEFALEKGNSGGFYALHCASRRGDLAAVRLLINRGHDINMVDVDDYTPLMLAAREGHGKLCELLISSGARCDVRNCRGETALILARKSSVFGNEAETVILDEMARIFVLEGGKVKKHTKRGKGRVHEKTMRMVGGAGVLRWGRSSKRNVVCKEASMGGSSVFQRNRRRKGDGFREGLFRIVTTYGKEFHFVCEGGDEAAALWVRGIRNVTRSAFV